MPPTYATSRSGWSRWRSTTSFWWWEPPGRTRMSSRHSPPARAISSPKRRFSSWLKWRLSRWERQSRPLTMTPRSAARHRTAPISVPGPSSRSSGSPRQSVNSSRSPSRIASTAARSSAKYEAPWTSGRARLPQDQAAPSARRSSRRVAGLPRSPRTRSHCTRVIGPALRLRRTGRRGSSPRRPPAGPRCGGPAPGRAGPGTPGARGRASPPWPPAGRRRCCRGRGPR